MTQTEIIRICREALMMVVILGAPTLAIGMFVGLVIGIFQATTQIQEQTISFVPKLIAVFITLVLTAGWMMNVATSFTQRLFEQIPNIVR